MHVPLRRASDNLLLHTLSSAAIRRRSGTNISANIKCRAEYSADSHPVAKLSGERKNSHQFYSANTTKLVTTTLRLRVLVL
jgi:hypothetical protein